MARVRQAAGELIDNVNKAPRRKQTVDEKYLTKLFGTVTTQYKLDELKGVAGGQNAASDEPLPAGSVALIVGLAVSWAAIIASVSVVQIRKRRLKK